MGGRHSHPVRTAEPPGAEAAGHRQWPVQPEQPDLRPQPLSWRVSRFRPPCPGRLRRDGHLGVLPPAWSADHLRAGREVLPLFRPGQQRPRHLASGAGRRRSRCADGLAGGGHSAGEIRWVHPDRLRRFSVGRSGHPHRRRRRRAQAGRHKVRLPACQDSRPQVYPSPPLPGAAEHRPHLAKIPEGGAGRCGGEAADGTGAGSRGSGTGAVHRLRGHRCSCLWICCPMCPKRSWWSCWHSGRCFVRN